MLKFLLPIIFVFFSLSWGGILKIFMFLCILFMMNSFEGFSLSNYFGFVSGENYGLILLSMWVMILCVLSSQYISHTYNKKNFFLLCFTVLFLFLVASFFVSSFLLFYIMFECSVVPVLMIILGWGYQPERIRAGLYMLFYTFFSSMPLFLTIVYNNSYYVKNMMTMSLNSGWADGVVLYFLVSAFLVKFPMYAVHLWLPKAHVEAPVSGSMVLAGVMLKLGGYGMLRFIGLNHIVNTFFTNMVIGFSVLGGAVASFICLGQSDMKCLVAYSSVVHMSGCIGGILSMSEWGKMGAIYMMLAHGLCSSGLFFLCGFIYQLTGSRSLMVNKGLLNILPSMSLWWFLMLATNMACPPTLNLLSEIKLISCLLNWSGVFLTPIVVMVFVSCCYSMYLYSLSQHGKYVYSKQSIGSNSLLNYLILVAHWIPLNILIIYLYFLI